MIKSIINPGNGINFAMKGDYIKFYLTLRDSDGNYLIKNLTKVVRFGFDQFLKPEIESLLGEMSLLEKCNLEVPDEMIPQLNGDNKSRKDKLSYDIQILDISLKPL